MVRDRAGVDPGMRALLSVHDKRGIVDFARSLVDLGFDLVSTGGTERAIREAGIPVQQVADVTGSPEILDGRVKTLHPRIHGGLLARLDLPTHQQQLAEHGITPISLVACNLYPFEQTIAVPGVSLDDAVEQIDIGGPAMIRAAAKNFSHVIVVSDPNDYDRILDALRTGGLDTPSRRALAAKAFGHVSAYDALVSGYLRGEERFPSELTFAGRKVAELRYGENPAQSAAAYRRLMPNGITQSVLDAEQLGGKELSYNNLLDADAAWNAIRRFERPAVSVVKHNIPCGLAVRNELSNAYAAAFEGDTVSAFGGIVALNREIDGATAEAMSGVFYEVVIAPGFSPEALAILGKKKQLRLLRMPAHPTRFRLDELQVRPIAGGLLVQDPDVADDNIGDWSVVSRRQPTAAEWRDLQFAWEAARHVKSNAIVLARDEAVVGVGAGQPNRLESVRIAASKAGPRGSGAALASDAFFPFADGVEAALTSGATAIVQPGGSVRDQEVIDAVDAAGAAMVFTGKRHFLH